MKQYTVLLSQQLEDEELKLFHSYVAEINFNYHNNNTVELLCSGPLWNINLCPL